MKNYIHFYFKTTKLFLLVFILLSFINNSSATTCTWVGGSGYSWTNSSNWTNGVPSDLNNNRDDIIINEVGTYTITNVPSIIINSLTINSSASVTLATSSSSNITIEGALTANGNLVLSSLGINFAGTASSNINSGLTLTNSDFTLSGALNLYINGYVTATNSSILSSVSGSTVFYSREDELQHVLPGYYYNLTFNSDVTNNYTKYLPASEIYISGTFDTGILSGNVITDNTIIFNGTTQQNIPAFNSTLGGLSIGYNNLQVDNPNGATTANALDKIYISKILTLIQGNIITSGAGTKMIVINNLDVDAITTPTVFSAELCIVGGLQRAIPAGTGLDPYIFPIADINLDYKPITIYELIVTHWGFIYAECVADENGGEPGPGFVTINTLYYWRLFLLNQIELSNIIVSFTESNLDGCSKIGQYIPENNWYLPITSTATLLEIQIENPTLEILNTFSIGKICGVGLWLGTEDSDINNENNWDVVPTGSSCPGTDIAIDSYAPNMPVIGENDEVYVHNLIINPLASVTVNGLLHVCNNLYIRANIDGTGGITQSEGDGGASRIIFENIAGKATINGVITNSSSHVISSPFVTATINDIGNFTPVNLDNTFYDPDHPYIVGHMPNMFKVIEENTHNVMYDQNAWRSLDVDETMIPMVGYSIYDTRANFIFNVHHEGNDLAQGDLVYSASHSAVSLDTDHNWPPIKIDIYGKTDANGGEYGVGPGNGWHLVGNPYPSPVDWNLVAASTEFETEISTTIAYFKDIDNNGLVNAYWNPTTGSSGAFDVTEFIPIMQAFYIHNMDQNFTSHDLTFKNEYRSVGYNNDDPPVYSLATGPHYKKGNIKSNEDKVQSLRISAYKVDKAQYKDEVVVMFTDKVKGDFDNRYDGYKRLNTAPDVPTIYINLEGRYLNNHAYNKLSDKLVVPLGIYINTAGVYSINFSDPKKSAAGTHVYLVDAVYKTSHDLSLKSSYSFKLNEGAINDRFYLKFSDDASGINDLSSLEIINMYSSANNLEVNINNLNNEEADLCIYNLNGQKLMDNTKLSNGTFNYKLDYAPGIYFVKLVTQHDVYTKKIFIQ